MSYEAVRRVLLAARRHQVVNVSTHHPPDRESTQRLPMQATGEAGPSCTPSPSSHDKCITGEQTPHRKRLTRERKPGGNRAPDPSADSADDAEVLFAFFSDEEVSSKRHRSVEESQAFIQPLQHRYQAHENVEWGITRKGDDVLI